MKDDEANNVAYSNFNPISLPQHYSP